MPAMMCKHAASTSLAALAGWAPFALSAAALPAVERTSPSAWAFAHGHQADSARAQSAAQTAPSAPLPVRCISSPRLSMLHDEMSVRWWRTSHVGVGGALLGVYNSEQLPRWLPRLASVRSSSQPDGEHSFACTGAARAARTPHCASAWSMYAADVRDIDL
jgi:hypothetical protein